MTELDLIYFLKNEDLYQEDIYNYYKKHMKKIKDPTLEQGLFYGLYLDKKDNTLTSFKGMVPVICNLKTLLVNIHEYMHTYLLFTLLEKPYQESVYDDILPMALEALYIEKYQQAFKEEFLTYRKHLQKQATSKPHLIGFSNTQYVLDFYNQYGYFPKTTEDFLEKQLIKH